VLVGRAGGVVTWTINRPKVLNALDGATLAELEQAIDGAGDARVAILTGAGDRAFVAGADIAAMSTLTPAEATAFARLGQRVFRKLEELPIPVVAAVNGFALGGGCELALACDFIHAARTAKLAQPEIKLGIIPGFGGTQRLARRVGLGRARELIYLGEPIGADEALRLGLVNGVHEPAELLPAVQRLAETLASRPPMALAAAKRVLLWGSDVPLEAACELEAAQFAGLFASEDQREGMVAFVEKRAPQFRGR
jgi:enoyl-CoA hydratase